MMKRLILFTLSLILANTYAIAGNEIYLPNLKKNVTGTQSGSNVGIDVNVASGSLTITEAAVAGNGSALPAQQKVISGYDGSVTRVIKTDAGGAIQVDVESSALPSGASTEAKQDTGNASLSSIDGKVANNYGVATGAVRTASQVGNASGVADFNAGNTSAQTLRTVIATNQSAIPVSQSGTWNVNNIGGTISLPSGASTEAKQDTGNASLASIDFKLQQGYGDEASTIRTASQLGNQTGPIDYNTGTASAQTPRFVIASDQPTISVDPSGVTSPISAASLPLPAGAATEAKQDTGNTSLSSINGKIASDFGVSSGAVRTAAQVGNATGAAAFGAGNSSAQTLRTVIATDQSAIPSSQSGTWSVRTQDGSGNLLTSAAAGAQRPLDVSIRDSSGNLISPVSFGTSGSQSNATVSTAITLTAPAGAMGFLLTNLDTSTANIRWAVGATASASVGTQLQPGRDTGFLPVGADISVCSESGTQNYSVQWLIR